MQRVLEKGFKLKLKKMETLKKQHETVNNTLDYLADKWHIGALSGFFAWIIGNLSFMFDDYVLKIVAGVGIYVGLFVAVLTALLKMLDVWDKVKKMLKRK